LDKIGIVSITYNSANVLQNFLNCVWEQEYQNLILYVIDNASNDGTLDILEKEIDSRLRIIKNDSNLGVAKANNQGIKRAISDACDQILIINNDVEFSADLITQLLSVQNKNKCSLVTPKMMFFDKPSCIWYAGSWFVKNKGYLPIHRGMQEEDRGQYEEIVEVEYAPTCCLLAKKAIFHDIGLMDEKYFVYFDDTDFSYRVWKDKRHKMFYAPKAKLFHKVGSLTKSFQQTNQKTYRGSFFIKQNTRNHVYFLKKIGGLFAYVFIVWLFFKNNIQFIIDPKIRITRSNWWLINKSFFDGVFM
jgi:GT2 family glycosyltransferase